MPRKLDRTTTATADDWTAGACVLHVDEPLGSRSMLIFFGGVGGAFGGVGPFEFRRTVSGVRTHQTFLRDPTNLWYLHGVAGVAGSADELAAHLRAECERRGVKRVVTVGNSAGGYAAILFGVLMGADEVHAFAPKSRVLETEDFHDHAKLRFLLAGVGRDHPYLDLRPLLAARVGGPTTIHVHYPNGDTVDAHQALRLAGLPNVKLWRYRWRRHSLVRVLKDYGVLRPLLVAAVRGSRPRLALIFAWVRFRMRLTVIRESIVRRAPWGAREAEPDGAD